MMKEEENIQISPLQHLLERRRKLLDLRKKVTPNRIINEKFTGDSHPGTPNSNTLSSISPPPYSPLTPLFRNVNEKNDHKSQGIPVPGTSKLQIESRVCSPLQSRSPSILSEAINNESPVLSSPLRSMSPDTLQMFNMLNESHENDIIENSEISFRDERDYCDSDDSVRDPNYEISRPSKIVSESDTSCSSYNGNEEKTSNNSTLREVPSNGETVISGLDSNANTINEQSIKSISLVTEKITEGNEYNSSENEISEITTGRPKKGRKRIHPQKRSERKYNKYNNLEYTTLKHKKVEPKVFVDYQCTCLKNCASLVSADIRKREFDKFVQLGSYNAQLLYIGSCVKEENKKRSYTMTNVPAEKKKPKQYHRTYSIDNVKVCRDMFLKTFQITTQKVTISLQKLRSGEPIKDRRGMNTVSHNKIPEEHRNFIKDIINRLPKYISHYGRGSTDALYLQPGMTLAKIHNIYCQEYREKYGEESKCVSLEYVKNIFYTNFNLRCKKLKKDTCNTCDRLVVKISNAKSLEDKEAAETEKALHLKRAKNLRQQMKSDFIEAQNSPNVECLSFDLEKTLPLPRISTNVAFYKRQLWFYNSGIHSASDDIGHCFVWVEGEAGRGAQEVGSCLMKYIDTKLKPFVEHLILWSDCCGGQNRNIKIVLMMKAVLSSHQSLKTITFKYLESGHTFLPNDTDFSKIETALKHYERIYTADEYIKVIKNSKKKKPFQVYKMLKNDFWSTEKLEKNIVNRKKFIDKSKVSWLCVKEIKIQKDKPYSIFMRATTDESYKELSIEKKVKGDIYKINKSDLSLLWPDGKAIAPAKLADLQSMFQYIPEVCQDFYKKLRSSDDITDDVDGFGGVPDFEIEVEES